MFEPHRRHSVVSFSKNINPSLVLVQPRKTLPFITERLLMGRKESNQTNKKIQLNLLDEGHECGILFKSLGQWFITLLFYSGCLEDERDFKGAIYR